MKTHWTAANDGIPGKPQSLEEHAEIERNNPSTMYIDEKIDYYKQHTCVKRVRGKWCAYLVVDQQSFCICETDDKQLALWFTNMLAIALERLYRKSSATDRG